MFGVTIEKGPCEWQIMQQENGYAKAEISGHYERMENYFDENQKILEIPAIYIMVSREETGEPVIWWTKCNLSDGNKWNITLDIPTGGPYTVHTSMSETNDPSWSEWGIRGDVIRHIGVGDLFVIAGQSNSSGYGKDFIYDPPEIGINIYKNNHKWDIAAHPLQDSTGGNDNPNADICNTGHSLYLSFAKYLKRELNYPIGLIQTSRGGSPLSRWNPEEEGTLYKNMIDRINECGGKIKGIIWYQGCNDTYEKETATTYFKRFGIMKKTIEKDLGKKDIPFVVFQLAYCNNAGSEYNDFLWGTVKDEIRKLGEAYDNLYVVPTSDATFSDHIHISAASNIRLGERGAKILLKHIYGCNYMCDAPEIIKAVKTGEKEVELSFKNVYDKLTVTSDAENIAIKAENSQGIFGVEKFSIKDKNKLHLTFEKSITNETFIHGGYTKVREGFLPFDYATHIPVISFYKIKVR